ncbi:hypothetical protein KR215_008556 [Drosophila sulfurigaster]|nr:hypothetical protein KR215_008556 [Drosophila sulfurigaster]
MNTSTFEKYTTTQLKKWLTALCLPATGNKAKLIKRLLDVSPEMFEEVPSGSNDLLNLANILSGQENELPNNIERHDQTQNVPENSDLGESIRQDLLNTIQKLQEELRLVKEELRNSQNNAAAHQMSTTEIDNNNNGATQFLRAAAQRSAPEVANLGDNNNNNDSNGIDTNNNGATHLLDLCTAAQSAAPEVANLGGSNDNNNNISSSLCQVMGSTGNVTDSTVEEKNELKEVKCGSAVSLALAKEATLEFDGKYCARIWVNQLKRVADMCKLDEESLRMLLAVKLKGNAQHWLHANSTRLREPFHKLCDQLIITFGTVASKTELRRKFEQRKWQQNERFAMYFEEKIALSQSITLDNDELLEHIIEGIPELNLRNQARIQRFGDPEQMLQAFAHICLPKCDAIEGTKMTAENNDK